MSSVSLTLEILKTLSRENALWDKCCGPNGNGLSASNLLNLLQVTYPLSNWTLLTLEDLLISSQQRGRVKQLPADSWYLNTAMNIVNPANKIYSSASSAICAVPGGCKCNTVSIAS